MANINIVVGVIKRVKWYNYVNSFLKIKKNFKFYFLKMIENRLAMLASKSLFKIKEKFVRCSF